MPLRLIGIGDIHGHLQKLQQLIELIELIEPNECTKLVFLGDYVCYGEDMDTVPDEDDGPVCGRWNTSIDVVPSSLLGQLFSRCSFEKLSEQNLPRLRHTFQSDIYRPGLNERSCFP